MAPRAARLRTKIEGSPGRHGWPNFGYLAQASMEFCVQVKVGGSALPLSSAVPQRFRLSSAPDDFCLVTMEAS